MCDARCPLLTQSGHWSDPEYSGEWPHLFGWQTQGCEISSNDDFPSKSTLLGSLPVVRFRQRAAGNFERTLFFRAERRDHVRQDQIFRTCSLGECTKMKGITLPKIGVEQEPAGFNRAHYGVDRRMHDRIGTLSQPFNLFGC